MSKDDQFQDVQAEISLIEGEKRDVIKNLKKEIESIREDSRPYSKNLVNIVDVFILIDEESGFLTYPRHDIEYYRESLRNIIKNGIKTEDKDLKANLLEKGIDFKEVENFIKDHGLKNPDFCLKISRVLKPNESNMFLNLQKYCKTQSVFKQLNYLNMYQSPLTIYSEFYNILSQEIKNAKLSLDEREEEDEPNPLESSVPVKLSPLESSPVKCPFESSVPVKLSPLESSPVKCPFEYRKFQISLVNIVLIIFVIVFILFVSWMIWSFL